MNESMINNWNLKCDDNSIVYFLGDFALGAQHSQIQDILERLKFKTMYFISGNHEKSFRNWYRRYCDGALTLKDKEVVLRPDLEEIKIGEQHISLCHYPLAEWNGSFYGSWMLHGHSHGNHKRGRPESQDGKILDVGVDCHKMAPVSLEEIGTIMENK